MSTYSLAYQLSLQAMMSGYRVTHSSAAGRFADGQPGPEGIHQASSLLVSRVSKFYSLSFRRGAARPTRRAS